MVTLPSSLPPFILSSFLITLLYFGMMSPGLSTSTLCGPREYLRKLFTVTLYAERSVVKYLSYVINFGFPITGVDSPRSTRPRAGTVKQGRKYASLRHLTRIVVTSGTGRRLSWPT